MGETMRPNNLELDAIALVGNGNPINWENFVSDANISRSLIHSSERETRQQKAIHCRRQDLNLHDLAITRPSTWRVCQFRHSGSATTD
jgi:hypothetical protein